MCLGGVQLCAECGGERDIWHGSYGDRQYVSHGIGLWLTGRRLCPDIQYSQNLVKLSKYARCIHQSMSP